MHVGIGAVTHKTSAHGVLQNNKKCKTEETDHSKSAEQSNVNGADEGSHWKCNFSQAKKNRNATKTLQRDDDLFVNTHTTYMSKHKLVCGCLSSFYTLCLETNDHPMVRKEVGGNPPRSRLPSSISKRVLESADKRATPRPNIVSAGEHLSDGLRMSKEHREFVVCFPSTRDTSCARVCGLFQNVARSRQEPLWETTLNSSQTNSSASDNNEVQTGRKL